jgi:hypothetical protein
MNFDYKNMETYQYFVAAGAGLVVIALLLYCFKGKKIRVSAFFATTLGALALGFGIGIITLGAAGYHWEEQTKDEGKEKAPANAQANPRDKKNPNQGQNQKKGDTISARLQLAAYITKLNQLTTAPSIDLGDRKAKVAEQLKDLDTLDTLTNEDAEARLKALRELFKADEATLQAAGLDLQRAGVVGKGKNADPANPFKSEANKAALNALGERASKN